MSRACSRSARDQWGQPRTAEVLLALRGELRYQGGDDAVRRCPQGATDPPHPWPARRFHGWRPSPWLSGPPRCAESRPGRPSRSPYAIWMPCASRVGAMQTHGYGATGTRRTSTRTQDQPQSLGHQGSLAWVHRPRARRGVAAGRRLAAQSRSWPQQSPSSVPCSRGRRSHCRAGGTTAGAP